MAFSWTGWSFTGSRGCGQTPAALELLREETWDWKVAAACAHRIAAALGHEQHWPCFLTSKSLGKASHSAEASGQRRARPVDSWGQEAVSFPVSLASPRPFKASCHSGSLYDWNEHIYGSKACCREIPGRCGFSQKMVQGMAGVPFGAVDPSTCRVWNGKPHLIVMSESCHNFSAVFGLYSGVPADQQGPC